ncbi:alpha/beta hydrolase [Olleya sp. YS]|uniref:alpha/beta hydrolase n=1 Tax=Olleya sp. YS TaxID=3028318 RepID=UPI0024345488|nr:alpha/beta hydrolase [Olleya sp. YS]WGD33567.1 alpha/beta hydrolase [Olleya sp. YS]
MKIIYITILILISFSTQAQHMKTFTYATKGLDTLKMDVYTPKNIKSTDRLPVIIWMHGGGFSSGTRNGTDEKNITEFATTRGYIGVSISYRLLRLGADTGFGCNCPKEDKLFTFNQAVLDFLDATNFIYQNSTMLQVDTTKIIAAGSSAGAETILNAVYMKSYFLSNPSDYKNINFAGVISYSGALLDVNYITDKNAIPTVLIHGDKDKVVPFGTAPHQNCHPTKSGYLMLDGSNTIAEKLKILKKPYYLNIITNGNHDAANMQVEQLESIFDFLSATIFENEILQITKYIAAKTINH